MKIQSLSIDTLRKYAMLGAQGKTPQGGVIYAAAVKALASRTRMNAKKIRRQARSQFWAKN